MSAMNPFGTGGTSSALNLHTRSKNAGQGVCRPALSEQTSLPLEGLAISYPAMHNPVSFRYFKTSPEIIQLAVMLYVRFPLSLRNVEDLLHERGVDVSYESVRYWWRRFDSKFASEIKKRRAGGMQSCNWKMHSLQKFASIHASFHNHFNSQRLLSKRSTFELNRDVALTEWCSLIAS
jgi:transposase-like protein